MENEKTMLEVNTITMSLKEFLCYHEIARKLDAIKDYATESICNYDATRRNDYDIGAYVRDMFSIPEKREVVE